jgi:hypothetical protein
MQNWVKGVDGQDQHKSQDLLLELNHEDGGDALVEEEEELRGGGGGGWGL